MLGRAERWVMFNQRANWDLFGSFWEFSFSPMYSWRLSIFSVLKETTQFNLFCDEKGPFIQSTHQLLGNYCFFLLTQKKKKTGWNINSILGHWSWLSRAPSAGSCPYIILFHFKAEKRRPRPPFDPFALQLSTTARAGPCPSKGAATQSICSHGWQGSKLQLCVLWNVV